MKLYKISDKGELIELNKLDYNEHDVYLIDDEIKSKVYIWVGLEVPQYKKDITAAWARKIDKSRGNISKILIMKQKREYGSFLAMMDDLSKGLLPGESIERRPELILQEAQKTVKSMNVKEPESSSEDEINVRITKWLKQLKFYRKSDFKDVIEESERVEEELKEDVEEIGLEPQIREAAYYLSLENYSYNDLCWLLAEKILRVNLKMPSLEDIRKKAEEVFNSSCSYDELCWLNAEVDLLTQEKYLEKETEKFEYK